jgi:hypothetical protein
VAPVACTVKLFTAVMVANCKMFVNIMTLPPLSNICRQAKRQVGVLLGLY